MKIRTEHPNDYKQITQIHNLAFEGLDEGKIVESLRTNKNLKISLVCEMDDKLAGHIAYSPIKDHQQNTIGIGLAPVAVLPDFQNQGIGSALIKHGNKIAFDIGYKIIFVLGEPKYYTRFGFVLAKNYNYFCKFDPEGDHFMVQGPRKKEPEKTAVYYCEDFNV